MCIKVEFLHDKSFAWLTILLLRTEKELCSTLFLANKYVWILFITCGESLFIFRTCSGEMVVGAGFQVERSFTFMEVS